ncbi:MAG: YpiB family protein [Mycobacterium leprae]
MEKPMEARSTTDRIRSFLDRCQPKLAEARGFLQFLLSKDDIMRHVVIVDDLSDCPDAILISAQGSEGWPFFYRRGSHYVGTPIQAVDELEKGVPEHLYLCLSNVSPGWSEERTELVATLTQWHEDVFADEVGRLFQRQRLWDQIDTALATGDQESFERLTAELRKLR